MDRRVTEWEEVRLDIKKTSLHGAAGQGDGRGLDRLIEENASIKTAGPAGMSRCDRHGPVRMPEQKRCDDAIALKVVVA
jgi:hypothetical protein